MASALLAELDLGGKVVTGDALYAQRELSRQVLGLGGDYFGGSRTTSSTLRRR